MADDPKLSWEDWKTQLVACAMLDGFELVNPDDYKDYYEDGYTPQEAWDEDINHGC